MKNTPFELGLSEPESIDVLIPLNDPVLNAVRQYEIHPSIASIKNDVRIEEILEFQPVSSLEVWNEINQLNRSKKIIFFSRLIQRSVTSVS